MTNSDKHTRCMLPHFRGLVFVVNMCILSVKNPTGFSGLCAASYRMVASHAGYPSTIPVGGIGASVGASPLEQGAGEVRLLLGGHYRSSKAGVDGAARQRTGA